jgi:hypothetical protein
MDLMQARVALRERSLLDVFDLTVRFVLSHLGAYAKLAAFVLVPAFLVSWGVAYAAGWIWGWVGVVALAAFAEAPFVVLASRLVFAERVGTGEAILVALRALPRLIAARILQAMAIGAGVVLLVASSLWVATIMLFIDEVLVLERATVGAAFGRAQRLATTQFGEALAALLVLAVMMGGAVFLVDYAGRDLMETILEMRAPPPIWREGGGWLPLAGFWIAMPIAATARFFVYLNIRTRVEGWDVQTRFAAIAARAAAEQSAEPGARAA